MISRALRGKYPFIIMVRVGTRPGKAHATEIAIRAAPPCCACLVPRAAPSYHHSKAGPRETGNWGWHSAPPLSARARRPIALHALDACDGLNGHLHRKPGRQLLLLLLLLLRLVWKVGPQLGPLTRLPEETRW